MFPMLMQVVCRVSLRGIRETLDRIIVSHFYLNFIYFHIFHTYTFDIEFRTSAWFELINYNIAWKYKRKPCWEALLERLMWGLCDVKLSIKYRKRNTGCYILNTGYGIRETKRHCCYETLKTGIPFVLSLLHLILHLLYTYY